MSKTEREKRERGENERVLREKRQEESEQGKTFGMKTKEREKQVA